MLKIIQKILVMYFVLPLQNNIVPDFSLLFPLFSFSSLFSFNSLVFVLVLVFTQLLAC